MARQLITPNLDPYIRQNGVVLQDWLGWCLAYVQTAFGAGWAGACAWDSWTQKTQFKHADRNIPGGLYVPIWFSHTGTYGGVTKNWGHVAIYRDGSVWSSPITHKPYADLWGSIEQVEQKYNCKYVGWSEDVAGTKVIEFDTQGDESMAIKNPEFIKNMYRYVGGREPSQAEINVHMAGTPESLLNGFIGGNDLEVVRLRQQLDSVKQALANEQAKPPKEVVKEVEKIVTEYVDRPVEVVKEVNPKWLDSVVNFIRGVLKIK